MYEIDENLILGADLNLKDIAPIAEYETVTAVEIRFEGYIKAADEDKIDAFNIDLTNYARMKKLIFCGCKVDFKRNTYTFYLYGREIGKAKKDIERFVKRHWVQEFSIEWIHDADWKIYKSGICPDKYKLQKICNEIKYENLKKAGLDFTRMYTQVSQLVFEDQWKAMECRNMAKESGFLKAIYEDNSDTVKENGLLPKYSHMVFLTLSGKVYLEHMNINTAKAIRFAERFGGGFEGWEIRGI